MQRLQQQALVVFGAIAIVYSVALLVHVTSTYDLRLYGGLTSTTNGVGVEVSRVGPDLDARGQVPRAATSDHGPDEITALPHFDRSTGEFSLRPTPAFPQFADAIAALNPATTPTPVAGQLDVAILDPTTVAAQLPPVVELGPDRDRWVQVEFARVIDGVRETKVGWVRLQRTPLSSLLISMAWFFLNLVIFVIAGLSLARRPNESATQAFFALCSVTLVAFLGGFHWSSLVTTPWLFYPFVLCAMFVAPVTLHFYLLFPHPHAVVRRWPWASLAAVYGLPTAVALLLAALLVWTDTLYNDPAAMANQMTSLAQLIYLCVVLSAGWFLVGMGVLVDRFLTSETHAERTQVQWILAAAVPASLPLGVVLYTATSNPAEFAYGLATKPLMLLASVFFTVAYAASITRHRLMETGQTWRRGLLYAAISFAAMALFCLLLGVWALVSGSAFIWSNVLVVSITALVVLVLMGWAGSRFQMASELQFHKEKFQLDKAMRRLGRAIDQLVDPGQLVQQMLESAREAVGAKGGAAYLRSATRDGFERVTQTGPREFPRRMPTNAPLAQELLSTGLFTRWAGAGPPLSAGMWQLEDLGGELACALDGGAELLGYVILAAKDEGQGYSAEDRNFLTALAKTTSLALESARGHQMIDTLREELQSKVDQVAEQQQRILFLQSELLGRGLPPPSPSASEATSESHLRHELRGSSPALRQVLSKVAKIARSSSSVLIRGESGSGKELIAQAIHRSSPRVEGPFVVVHCAALSQGLLESELFGHMKGAFTGADRDKIGRFEMADHGTLFLDEIGDVNFETQTKLLRALEEQAFERVGGIETIKVDVRLIAATHRNLEALIREGKFREDLYYRLNVISLTAPPLRERGDDVFELALHFLRVYAQRVGKPITRIDKEALAAMAAYSWPGNVRQLENAIERAVVLCEGNTLTKADLPPEVLESSAVITRPAAAKSSNKSNPRRSAARIAAVRDVYLAPPTGSLASASSLTNETSELERERLTAALARCNGNKSEAARLLGIPRSTLFSKLRKYGMK